MITEPGSVSGLTLALFYAIIINFGQNFSQFCLILPQFLYLFLTLQMNWGFVESFSVYVLKIQILLYNNTVDIENKRHLIKNSSISHGNSSISHGVTLKARLHDIKSFNLSRINLMSHESCNCALTNFF